MIPVAGGKEGGGGGGGGGLLPKKFAMTTALSYGDSF